MTSTFRLSAFDDEDPPQDDLDAEFASLEGQVSEAERTLEAIQRNLESKQRQHAAELARLTEKITEARSVAADGLKDQQIQHNAELRALAAEHEDRMANIKASLEANLQQNSAFAEMRRDIATLDRETKLTDVRRKAEQERSNIEELRSISDLNRRQKSLKRRDERNSLILHVRGLEDEVSTLQSTRREILAENRLKVTDLLTRIEVRRLEQRTFLATLQHDLSEREQLAQSRIAGLQEQIRCERAQIQTDTQFATEKCRHFQKIHQTMAKRGNQQVADLNREITKMQRMLRVAERGEQQVSAKNRSEMSKLQELQQETESMRRAAKGLNKELEETQTGNQTAASILRDAQKTPKGRQPTGSIFS
jgi:hypothetical protein